MDFLNKRKLTVNIYAKKAAAREKTFVNEQFTDETSLILTGKGFS